MKKKYGITYIAYGERQWLEFMGQRYSASKKQAIITIKSLSPERHAKIEEIK